jgi:hypothetical protein
MEAAITTSRTRAQRIRSALLILSALLLFVFGLLLLIAPAPVHDQHSMLLQHFPGAENGWIIGSQSRKSISLAGG